MRKPIFVRFPVYEDYDDIDTDNLEIACLNLDTINRFSTFNNDGLLNEIKSVICISTTHYEKRYYTSLTIEEIQAKIDREVIWQAD